MIEHKTMAGDNLSKIALHYYNDTNLSKQIAVYNKINDPDKINVGQVIRIPPNLYTFAKSENAQGLTVIHVITHKCQIAQPAFVKAGFSIKEVRCGDKVELTCESKNMPEQQAVIFDIIRTDTNASYHTETSTIASQKSKIEWVSQMAQRNTGVAPKVKLKVGAASNELMSAELLTIKEYSDIKSTTETINCSSGVFGWTGKFDIEFKNGLLNITVKIKLVNRLGPKPANGQPMPHAGPALSNADKISMKADIESKLSGIWKIHRKKCSRGSACSCSESNKCCKFKIKINVEFVESGQHHVVNLFQGSGRANATNWTRVKTRNNSWAHETGHLLGWYDEYIGGAVGTAPRWKPDNTSGIMNVGLTVPEEYYRDFKNWLNSKTSELWNLI